MDRTSHPSGSVTFLFTDVEGSTRLWENHADAMDIALATHDTILRAAIEDHSGYIFSTAGDSFGAAFPTPGSAMAATIAFQLHLLQATWPDTGQLKVRCAIHTGVAHERSGDYFGPPLNRCARLMAIAHGSQILVSGATAPLVQTALPPGATLRDVGKHRLKDLEEAEHVFQLSHPALPLEFPPLRSLGSFQTNLPEQVTTFVGRGEDLIRIGSLLETSRLVTLVGPGGSGKTRLAIQAGSDALDKYPAGVWFVGFSALSEPGLVANVIAEVIGVEGGDTDLVAGVASALGSAAALLILDNCEHLGTEASDIARQLLASCATLTVLATSQGPLEISGERLLRVEPMGVPATEDAGDLLGTDAVQLFIDRAIAADPSFAPDDQATLLVGDICRQLDGIPLAIELAAARLRHFGLVDIANRLDDRFSLLTRGDRTAASRQQTLRNAVDWSFGLLDETQQILFARLSVFAGAFDAATAETIAGFSPLARTDVLDLLADLTDRSLVTSEGRSSGSRRFRLLETLRIYGREVLQSSQESDQMLKRYTQHYVVFAKAAQNGLRSTAASTWHEEVAANHDELRSVLRRSIAADDIKSAADVAIGCWFYWYVSGHWDEGYRWLSRILDLGADLDTTTRAGLLRGIGGLATAMLRLPEGIEALSAEVDLRRQANDQPGLSAALLNLANAYALDARYDEALGMYGKSLEISKSLGEEISSVVSNMAWTALDMGDYELARQRFAETYDLAREEDERRNQGWGLLGVGLVDWLNGSLDDADASLVRACEIFTAFGDRPMVTFCRTFQSKVARDRGDLDEAAQILSQVAEALRDLSDPSGVGRWLVAAGTLHAIDGDQHTAARLLGAAGDPKNLPPWERVELNRFMPMLEASLGANQLHALMQEGAQSDHLALLNTNLHTYE